MRRKDLIASHYHENWATVFSQLRHSQTPGFSLPDLQEERLHLFRRAIQTDGRYLRLKVWLM